MFINLYKIEEVSSKMQLHTVYTKKTQFSSLTITSNRNYVLSLYENV